jgi:diguanylate cyclase (GGDEF)-like protein
MIRYKVQKNEMRTIGVIMDVTKEYLEKQEIRTQRDQDPLTGLLNRKAFQYTCEQRFAKDGLMVSALVMFDLDNLKRMNDTYGHRWGDQYIKKAVEFLQNIGDSTKKVLGRRSGDEFVMLLTGYLSKEDILKDLEEAYATRSLYFMEVSDAERIIVSISSGIVFIGSESDMYTYEEYLQFADEALYQAKETKKGSYIIYEEKHF